MKITVLENEKDKLKIEVDGSLTLVNLLNENVWKQSGVDVSSYKVEHPYLTKPVLLVRSKNPKKALLDAAAQIVDDIEELRRKVEKEFK
ncbi:MAG: hypothetical protein HYY37_05895 [Candidatus Aenigmarchaeota archaeon]|nr:hypothetical protein [Candidatus Aenigmarchaeota archaeon]